MKYNVLLIDPPWSYKNKNTGGSMKSGAANQYPVMTIEEIKQLPIKQICEKDSVLFLWAVVPLLPEAFQVMKAWGFKYKTSIFWRKIMSLGMGYWFRGQVEVLLLGMKGKVKAFRCQKPNIIQCKVGKHSEKPEEFRQLIEEATKNIPNRKMVELFARKQVDGWNAIGNDIDGQDIKDVLLFNYNNQI
jgi:N6-adenosine-specific RNA methylase IME4